ncbi:MAG: M3 family oligoendopeptidase [Bacteroidetes bacterium]|nr:M3 family oligoendopeptidase [Bacteroidota bacterium]
MDFHSFPYHRPAMQTLKNQFSQLFVELKKAEEYAAFISVFKKINLLRKEFESARTTNSIRHSINTKDDFYSQENTFFNENIPLFEQLINDFYKIIVGSKFIKEINEEFGDYFLKKVDCTLKTFNDTILSDLVKENELVTKYSKLQASAEIEFKGEKLTMSQLGAHSVNKDRSVRKSAADAGHSWYAERGNEFDVIFDDLVKIRHKIAVQLGFKNYTELAYKRLNRTDYGPEEVKGFRDSIHKHICPVTAQLKQQQATRINLEKPEYYDWFFNFQSGNATPKGGAKWITEKAQKMYNELAPESAEFFSFMSKNKMMDLESKPGKAAGGYCTFIESYPSPYIFSNFNGTDGDVLVLTHEIGHAFQVYCSMNQPLPEYYWPTTDACEIHSMSMEFLTWPWMNEFFEEETEKFKYSHLSNQLLFLPYGAAIDEFQHWIYENHEVTPAVRNKMWLEIESKYLPYRTNSSSPYLNSGRQWQRQLHLYHFPFYYIDYALAQVCAYQFWLESRKDANKAWEKYLALCRMGGSDSFINLLTKAGLKNPFNEAVLIEISNEVQSYIEKNKVE